MPPPRVRPPTPVVEMMPPVVASPNGYAACVEVSPGRTTGHPRSLGERVDAHAAHGRQVDDHAVVTRAEAGDTVAATAYGDGQGVVGGETDCGHHVAGVDRLHDDGRPLIDHAVADLTSDVVPLVIRGGYGPPDPLAQCGHCSVVHGAAPHPLSRR